MYTIYQNYPNPFNPVTTIHYDLPANANIEIVVYNIKGQKIMTLVDEYKLAGSYSLKWDATEISSGIYFYQLKAGEYSVVKKCIILK